MPSAYELPAPQLITCELEVKRSRFITWLNRTSTEEEARAPVSYTHLTLPTNREV